MKEIKVLSLTRVSGAELLSTANGVNTGIAGHSAIFTNVPIDMAAFKSQIDKYQIAFNDSKDGGKKAIIEASKQKDALVEMLRVLARYVEMISKNDMATFLLSGFKPAATTRNPSQPLKPAKIKKIKPGVSGQLLVSPEPQPGALSYDIRWAPLGAAGSPGTWVISTVTSAKSAAPINGLTPGTNYAFQVRALGKLGYTDWSDSVTRICA